MNGEKPDAAVLELAMNADPSLPCPEEFIDDVVKWARKIIEWAYASKEPDLIVQSLMVTCCSRRNPKEGEGKALPLIFHPTGEDMTPDDCIALALAGAQWALGANQMMKAKAMEELKKRQGPGHASPIWTPDMNRRIPVQ